MIYPTSDIKIGHSVEKVFDMIECAPFNMEYCSSDHVYVITTQYGNIIVTGDTQLQRPNGSYIYVERIKPINTALRHVCGTAVVTGVKKFDDCIDMVKVTDTDYVIVNGFYVRVDE